MKQQDYNCSITANITAEEAFDNINRVWEWWAKNFKGSSENLNDVFTVDFGPTFVTFKVTEFVPYKKIGWQVTDCYLHWLKDKTEWNGTNIAWEISPAGDATRINFTHFGLVPDVECYEACRDGWNGYIKGSLYKLVTEHKGVPA